IDVLATLQARHHAGPILAMSRNGRWPAQHHLMGGRHAVRQQPKPNAAAYVTWMRQEIARAEKSGTDWRRGFDGIRPQIQGLWQALPVSEQARLMRHARNLWDASRHQMPPPSRARLEQLRTSRRLRSVAARLTHVARRGNRCTASYRPRGAAPET